MKGAVTISILLPTHNRAATTTIALQSLLGQSFQDWEVLVVGDGCDDGTGELVKAVAESDPRVRWFDLPKGANFGYANRNIALREARGELIGFLADDDLYFFSHVERLVALMKDPAVQLGVSSALWVDTSGHMIPVVAPLHDAGYR
ncbi:glycosyltransferase, partial [Verrucomicrobiales bacterium]|nr:glycosyltransferase [Verrucomicrobiales bacterium]